MKDISLKQRLIIPIALLGMVALLSNILSLINIHNVNANAANIADNYMDGKSRLAKISQSSMNIHKMALSHIVATDYNTMILLVQQIKEEEALLDDMLAEYENYVIPEDQTQYESLLSDYASFKHALVYLVCASAGHKTQDAYILANGDVAAYAGAMGKDIDALNTSISDQTARARTRLSICIYYLSGGGCRCSYRLYFVSICGYETYYQQRCDSCQEYSEYYPGKFGTHQQYDRRCVKQYPDFQRKRGRSLLSRPPDIRNHSGCGRQYIGHQRQCTVCIIGCSEYGGRMRRDH